MKHLCINPPGYIYYEKDTMPNVMQKFQDTGAWNLPVIKNGKYFGFVSKSKLLTAYRRELINFTSMKFILWIFFIASAGSIITGFLLSLTSWKYYCWIVCLYLEYGFSIFFEKLIVFGVWVI